MYLLAKKKRMLSLLTLFFVSSLQLNFVAYPSAVEDVKDSSWVLRKEGNGTKVFTRNVDSANSREFKAITITTQPMDSLEKMIEEVEKYPEWQSNVVQSKVLKTVSPEENYIHYVTDTPWPVVDRDMVLHAKKTTLPDGTVRYDLKSAEDILPPLDHMIRMTDGRGFWQFTPLKDNKIKVVYQFYANPAGTIPEWVVNLFSVSGPFETLENLKKR